MVLHLQYGNAVTGNQRYERPKLQKRLMRSLNGNAGAKMFGLRRIGKSTLRLYATEELEKRRTPVVFIDSQGLHSIHDFLARLHAEFAAKDEKQNLVSKAMAILSSGPAKAALEAVSKGTQYEQGALSAYWSLVSAAIRRAVETADPKPVLVVDEFTYLLDNLLKDVRGREKSEAAAAARLQEVDQFLASLREWRGAGMTMLLTGSLGFAGLARKYGLNREHLNDLQPIAIPEMDEAEARDFIEQAMASETCPGWSPAHTEAFLRECGVYYPCFLVRGLTVFEGEPAPDPSEIATVFETIVRPDLHNEFYNQFNRRFKEYAALENEERKHLLVPVLKAVMEAETSVAQSELPAPAPFDQTDLAIALDMLADDGFVHFVEAADGTRKWRPASRLALLWWKRAGLA